MRNARLVGAFTICLLTFTVAFAQFGPEGGGRGGGPRMLPLMTALDLDGDGEISASEIDQSSKSLKKLDKNGDGKLTEDELRPNGPGGEGRRRGPESGAGSDETVAQMMEFDTNKDGKLSKDELPERMRGIFARADADKDGFLTKDELLKMTRTEPGGRREGERGEGHGPGRPGPNGNPAAFIDRLFELDIDKDGKLSREELSKLPDQNGRFEPGPVRP